MKSAFASSLAVLLSLLSGCGPELLPETEASAPAENTDAPADTAAPQTADAAVITGLVSILAAGFAFVASKKRR
jgi:predicted small lipoprotein YifL